MAARRTRRERSKLKLLIRAGIISRKEAPRASSRRIEKKWDQWGALIANPEARPFHTYRPRSKTGRDALKWLAPSGVSTRGLKGIPVPIIAGVESARVRITRPNELRIYYSSGIVREQIRIELDPKMVATGKGLESLLDRVTEIESKNRVAVNIRTGPGVYSPLAHKQTTEQAITRLKTAYPNWRKWLQAIEVLVAR